MKIDMTTNEEGKIITALKDEEGNTRVNYIIDPVEEAQVQNEVGKLAREMCSRYSEIAKVKTTLDDEDYSELIIEYFTNPLVVENMRLFMSLITVRRLKEYIITLAREGRDNERHMQDNIAELSRAWGSGNTVTPEEVNEMTNTGAEVPTVEESITVPEIKPVDGLTVVDDNKEPDKYVMPYDPARGVVNYLDKPQLKIRYHREKFIDLPDVVQHGNFIDLATAKTYELKAGEFALLNLGISVECPVGYWMQIVPRSSTFKNFGILQTNSFGVIDTDYCGDDDIIKLPVYATRDTTIPKGSRVCQFRLVKDIPFDTVNVPKLEGKNRGGFGSTGVN